MSGDSVRRLTEGWGQVVAGQRDAEVAGLYALDSVEEKEVAELDPLEQQANLPTDGGMLLVRGEGWKEVKLVTVSAVRRQRKGGAQCLVRWAALCAVGTTHHPGAA